MKISTTVIMIAISSLSVPAIASDAYGTPFEGWGFVKDDWQLVCDNTLTCRAAGYADESMFDTPASILFTVIPQNPIPNVQVNFEYRENDTGSSGNELRATELWLNDKNYGAIENYELNAKQVQQLLSHSRLNTKIEIRVGNERWTISDKGMSAVLLKLDEVQGRVGTPIALVSKTSPNRRTPKSPRAAPVIKKAYSYADKDKKQLTPAKLVYFQKNINRWIDIDAERLIGFEDGMGECELVNPKTEAYQRMQEYDSNMPDWNFIPVDNKHTLAIHECWRGAYNIGAGYWLINHAKPSKPTLITISASDYSDGEIYAIHKDRGIGDCWSRKTWVWNGKTFALTEDSTTGMCRGFAGGAWNLPTYISKVIKSDNKVQ